MTRPLPPDDPPASHRWGRRPAPGHDEDARGRYGAATVCTLLALTLWLTLTLRQPDVVELDVPTDIVSLPEGEALVEPPPATVRMQVEGIRFRLLGLLARPPRLPIAAAQQEVLLETQFTRLPNDVRLRAVFPRTLRLRTAPIVTRRVPVRLQLTIGYAATYGVTDSVRLSPDSVTVQGAAEVLDALAYWPTEPRRLLRVRDTLRLAVPLADTLGGIVRRSLTLVRALVPVAAFTGGEREIDVRVRGVPSRAPTITLDPGTVRVRYRVLLGQYDAALRAADFYATVLYADLRADDTGRVRPSVNVPAGLVLRDVEVTPATVGYYTRVGE